MCESNGLVLKIHIYCGKSENVHKDEHVSQVVLQLKHLLLDKGYVLCRDNNTEYRNKYICGTLRNKLKGNKKKLWQKRSSANGKEMNLWLSVSAKIIGMTYRTYIRW